MRKFLHFGGGEALRCRVEFDALLESAEMFYANAGSKEASRLVFYTPTKYPT
jgi:hypothetical protein